jgi:tetratricopeptide (TPR) repeat protein
MWLAAGGLILLSVIVGLAVAAAIIRQRETAMIAEAVPSQSEPELATEPISAHFGPGSPAIRQGGIELAGHEVDALDTEEMENDTVPQGPAPKGGRIGKAPRAPFYTSADLDELQIAEAAAAHGKWAEAAQAYAEITMNPPVPIDVWYHRAIACLKSGDHATYREVCESLLDRIELNPLNVPPINLVAWMCAIGPEAVADPRRTVVLAEFLLAHLPDDPAARHAYLNTVGGVYLRAGKHDDAVQRLNEGIATTTDGATKQDWLLLALAYRHLRKPDAAQSALRQMPTNSPLNRRDSIWDTAEIELLEAEVARTLPSGRR